MEVVLPICVLRLCLRLLALWSGDAALDGEGGTIGAWHTEARGVASYLDAGYELFVGRNVSCADYSLCVHGRLRYAVVSNMSSRTSVPRQLGLDK